MRLSTVLKAAALAVAAAAIALIAAVKSIDFQRYKEVLSAAVRSATGRELVIAGPLELKLGLAPTISANGISLANAPWGSRRPMATAESIVAQVALLPLLHGEVVVKRLLLSGPDLLLETAADGRGNWQTAPTAAPAAAAGETGAPPTRFDIREMEIRDAKLAWRDSASGQIRSLTLARASVRPEGAGGGLAVQASGEIRGKGFDLSGSVGRLAEALAGGKWPVHVKVAAAGAVAIAEGTAGGGLDLNLTAQGDELASLIDLAGLRLPGHAETDKPTPPIGPFKLSAHFATSGKTMAIDQLDAAVGRRDVLMVTARGRLDDLPNASHLDVKVGAEGENPAALAPLVGALPAIGPVKLAGHLTRDGDTWRLGEVTGRLAGSEVSGELALALVPRPQLTGRLALGQLAVGEPAPAAAAPGRTVPSPAASPPSTDSRVIPADPLPLAGLRAIDADVMLSAAHLVLGRVELADAAAHLQLNHGRLSVEPVMARAAGGTVTAALGYDASLGQTGVLTARLAADGLDLGRLLKEAAGSDALSGGPTRIALDLRGRGETPRALAASLDGEVTASVGPGRIRNGAVDWAGGDLMFQLLGSLNPLARSEGETDLQCAAAHFTLRNGLATARRGIAMETAKTVVAGGGTVNLRDESLDLAFAPRARDGIGVNLGGTLASLTRLRGTLARPAVAVDEAGAARTAASVGAAVATGGLSLLGELVYDKASADDHPCRTALAGSGSAPLDKAQGGKAQGGAQRRPSAGGMLDRLFGR